MRHLALLALVIGSVAAAGCTNGNDTSDCFITKHDQLEVNRPAEPTIEFQIERCQGDADACTDLCTAVGVAHGITGIESCTVGFVADTAVKLDVTYEEPNPNDLCPVAGGAGGGLAGQPVSSPGGN